MTSIFMWGMVLGAVISLFTFWITFALIVNPKLKRTFEIELETKREFIRGIVTAKELTNNLNEMYEKIGEDHSQEVVNKLWNLVMDDDYDSEIPWEKLFDTWADI